MRKLLFALVATTFVSTASAAEKPFIGIGGSLGLNLDFINIVVPMNLAPVFRLEPFVGIAYDRASYDTNVAGALEMESTRDFILGASGYFVQEVGNNVELLLGGRLGFDFYKEKYDYVDAGSDSVDYAAFMLAAVGGAEYYFSPNFALGVEASLGLRTYADDADTRHTTVMTQTVATAKVFFK